MAELSITASLIIPVAGARLIRLPAAAAITQGQALYKNSSGQWALADADATETVTTQIAIATNEVTAANQFVDGMVEGNLGFGAILVANQGYSVGTTPGGIFIGILPASGDYLGFLGIATSTTNLKMHPLITGTVTA